MDFFRHDFMLREILEERKSLAGFLDAVFGFMCRNTDFYHIQNTKDDKLGFPRGVKEQILLSCMQKYEHTFDERKCNEDLFIDNPPPAVEEIEIGADDEIIEQKNITESLPTCNNEINDDMKTEPVEIVESMERVTKLNESEYNNGSLCKNYCWSQTLKDIEMTVLLPKEVKQGKHIRIDLKPNQISIKTLFPKEEILISSETWDKFRHNDVVWTITDGKLVLSLDKFKECWWDKLLVTEESINIKKVDTERFIDEYSEETQDVIGKVQSKNLLEQDFKTLPFSESEQMARLRQAWNAEASPFKGQPFDPSIIKFN